MKNPVVLREASRQLVEIALNDYDLYRKILATILLIAERSHIGQYVRNSRRIYTDPDETFRIGYNTAPKGKEIEVVVVNLISR